jgi:Na+-transporting NADH:ubiquinone oxidoreductase subunit NqrB
MLLKDARDYQILCLSLFLFLGISTRDWTLRSDVMLVAIVASLLFQWLFGAGLAWWQERDRSEDTLSSISLSACLLQPATLNSLKSATITALSLCLLLRTNLIATMAIAAGLAISSKFLFRVGDKHFFNPANFGIIGAVLLTSDAWVSPGQWGTDWWFLLLFVGMGGTVVQKVGRWETSIAFLVAYISLETLRNAWLGFGWDVLFHQLTSGSLLLFAFFMITDPRSIPNARISRLIWSVSLAGLTFVLQHQFFVPTAVFWALFCLSPLTVVLDWLWDGTRFQWRSPVPESPSCKLKGMRLGLTHTLNNWR